MTRINDIEANLHTAVVSMNSRQPAADIQDRAIARTLVDDGTDLMAFVRDVEARHVPSKTKLLETTANLSTAPGAAPDIWTLSGLKTVEVSSCDACHMPWPCADRRALDRLNGGA